MRLLLEIAGRRLDFHLGPIETEPFEPSPSGSTCGDLGRGGGSDHDDVRASVGFTASAPPLQPDPSLIEWRRR